MARQRTIQHPGFEFYETENYSVETYTQQTEALIVGFFPKGPVGKPVMISSIDELISKFGEPESDAEFYSYNGVESVVKNARSVTVVRIPYDNTMAVLGDRRESPRKSTYSKFYKCLTGKFCVIEETNNKYADLRNLFENPVKFKSVALSPSLMSEDDVLKFKGGVGSEEDFIIVNKFDEFKQSDGSEYYVGIIGTGNVLRSKNLTYDEAVNEIELFKDDSMFKSDDRSLTIGRSKAFWQSNGDLDEDGNALTVVSDMPKSMYEMFPNVSTIEKETKEDYVGISKRTVTFMSESAFETLEVGQKMPIADLRLVSEIASVDYSTVNASGTNILEDKTDNPAKYPSQFDLTGSEISIVEVPDEAFATEQLKAENTTYRLSYFDEEGKLDRSYLVKRSESGNMSYPYLWSLEIESEYDRPAGYNYFVDKKKDSNISVIVLKIKPSTLEAGTFTYEIAESFSGSIFKGSVDPLTNESTYIGDIINASSSLIEFYGKTKYKNYDSSTDCILVEHVIPYGLSVVADGYVDEFTDRKFCLNKIIKRKDIAESLDYLQVIEEMLGTVKNNLSYTYRDIYDCGLSSVVAYAAPDQAGDLYYDPTKFNADELIGTNYLNLYLWKKTIKAFARHCQNDHRLSMFHADGPRKLVLNGNLSRVDDLRQDMSDSVFTSRKVIATSVKDSNYLDINVQWYEALNPFNNLRTWIPNSVKLAQNITYNDIINDVWDAPAGHIYGIVSKIYRPAFNPVNSIKDLLYVNCLNYGQSWSDGYTTIEGQKTAYGEDSALNRINVRRLMIWLERFVQTTAIRFRYQPNTEALRSSLVNSLESEFSKLYVNGALYAYNLVCNEQNNTSEIIDRNELRLTVMVQPVKTLEFIVANFTITKTGQDLEEISVS